MASTDARAGFRLPWSSDRTESAPDRQLEPRLERVETVDARAPADVTSADEPSAGQVMSEAAAPETPTTAAGGRRPTKFLADLTSAMRATAEAARGATLDQFRVDAKSFVEGIHVRSADEAAALRRLADEDVAAVREWSKAEIAAIREDTERRIAARRQELEEQLDRQAGVVEADIERVQARVAAFEAEMDRFFDSLRDVVDPAAFAALAETMPEPAPFESVADVIVARRADEATAPPWPLAGTAQADETGESIIEPVVEDGTEAVERIEATDEAPALDGPTDADDTDGPGAAVEEAQANIEEAIVVEEASEATVVEEAVEADEASAFSATDLRLAALGVDADFEAAEAAAAADATLESPDDAARTTAVVVVGLVSVASIAGFKRHLGRLGGVNGVGVASTADGEFVFTVDHAGDLSLGHLIPSLPGFQARVLESDGAVIRVAAHDPEADA